MSKHNKIMDEQLRKLRETTETSLPPENFETRMRAALSTVPKRQQHFLPSLLFRRVGYSLVSILIALIILGSFNYNAFAYYGKKIIGYDALVSEQIAALHEAGEGQRIDKTVVLDDGTMFILDALASDENQFILYFRLSNPDGVSEMLKNEFRVNEVSGFFTNAARTHGTSMENDDGTEVIFTQSFKSVSPWAKKLKLSYYQPIDSNMGQYRDVQISYDPNQAMPTTLKKRMNKTVKVDDGKLKFKEIIATPTETIIKGKLKTETYLTGFNELGSINLIADEQKLAMEGSSLRSDIKGKSFELRYAPLPNHIKQLAIQVEKFTGYVELQQQVSLESLSEGAGAVAMPLAGTAETLLIHSISQKSNVVEVEISTSADVQLKGVRLRTTQDELELQTTINETWEKNIDGTLVKHRTLVFGVEEGMRQPLQIEELLVGGMYWNKTYDIVMDIPL